MGRSDFPRRRAGDPSIQTAPKIASHALSQNPRQYDILQGAMVRARELHPEADALYVSTSDDKHAGGYGFTLDDIVDADGETLLKTAEQQDAAGNALAEFLPHLRWRGVVGENKQGEGEVLIRLPEDLVYDLDFTAAQRFSGSLTGAQIRERFGLEPGELMALVGGPPESLQGALAALREGKQAEDGVVHTLTRVWIRMAPRQQTRAA